MDRTPLRLLPRQPRWAGRRSSLLTLALAGGLLLGGADRPARAAAAAGPVTLRALAAHPLLLAGERRTTYVKVGLLAAPRPQARRTPVNVVLVLDRSGSMSGDKLRRAQEAARLAVERLAADDLVALVAYSQEATLVLPATPAAQRERIFASIDGLEAQGQTALFAGLQRGAEELRRVFDRQRVNRIVLLSDGLANVGPSSVEEVAGLGAELGRSGIAVTTIGLGLDYNEDLMTQLAARSEGNHFFARSAADLRRGFDLEFTVGLDVAAQDVQIRIGCPAWARPVRLLGGEAEIHGQQAIVRLGQLYAGREAPLLLELEVTPGAEPGAGELATVEATFADLVTLASQRLQARVTVQFTRTPGLVEERANPEALADVALQLGNLRYREAMVQRDQGNTEAARLLLQTNAADLAAKGARYGSKKLESLSQSQTRSSANLDDGEWQLERKRMVDEQLELSAPATAY